MMHQICQDEESTQIWVGDGAGAGAGDGDGSRAGAMDWGTMVVLSMVMTWLSNTNAMIWMSTCGRV